MADLVNLTDGQSGSSVRAEINKSFEKVNTLVGNNSPSDVTFEELNGKVKNLIVSNLYWLHVNADAAFKGDTSLKDKSMNLNDFTFGDDLSSSQALAMSRYVTTIDPTVGEPDSVMRSPSLSYDYENNESILIYFKGRITPEGSNQIFMGDTFSTTSSGISFRVRPTGQIDLFLGDPEGGLFSGPTSEGVVFSDDETHSFAFYLDGHLRSYKWYIDGAADSALILFGGGVSKNTASSDTFNVGSGSAYPGGSAGVATRTNTLAILRSPQSLDINIVDEVVRQLNIDGTKLVGGVL